MIVETLEAEEVVAGGSSTKAFDPCLDTGEVGEGPVVESPIEAVRDKAAGGVEAVHEAAEEVEEVVAGGSSLRLLIRV